MRLIVFLGVLVLAASFGGALHPAGDSLSVFRPQLALIVLLLASAVWALGRRRVGGAGITAALAAGLTVWPGFLMPRSAPDIGGDEIRVYQKNMSFRMPDTLAVMRDIQSLDVTHVTLQEVDLENRAILGQLATEFPSQLLCGADRGVGGMAVLSRWPRTQAKGVCEWGFAAVQVTGPKGPVWVVSIHLNWPYPHSQDRQVERLLPILSALDGDVVIGGDFNMVPYANSARRIRQAAEVQAMPGLRNSFPEFSPVFPLAIDHIWAKTVSAVETRPLLGSDHLGLLATIGN